MADDQQAVQQQLTEQLQQEAQQQTTLTTTTTTTTTTASPGDVDSPVPTAPGLAAGLTGGAAAGREPRTDAERPLYANRSSLVPRTVSESNMEAFFVGTASCILGDARREPHGAAPRRRLHGLRRGRGT